MFGPAIAQGGTVVPAVRLGKARLPCAATLPCTHATGYLRRQLIILLPDPFLSDCIHQASQHIGETNCVTGKVLKIALGNKGVHFLDFFEDHPAYPFTVVVFPSDLKDVGDVRHLKGRTIMEPSNSD